MNVCINGCVSVCVWTGLSLTVFLESDEYLRGMTTGTGIHVVIHPHHTMPFPQENGLAIMAGTETNIALKLVGLI